MSHKSIFASFARPTQAPLTSKGDNFSQVEKAFPPALIGGEENTISPMKSGLEAPIAVSVDWLTISLVADSEKNLAEEIEFVESVIPGWPLRCLSVSTKNLTGCQRTWDYCGVDQDTGEAVSLFKLGMMDETTTGNAYLVISIPGHCCPHFDMQKLSVSGEARGAKITRVDLAADDFTGKLSVHRARCIYNTGGFQGKGKHHGSMPKWSEVKSGRGKESHGKTFYVGDRSNGKMLRVYEKGLKDDPTRPQWVRWEVQFGSKDRTLEWKMLRDPAAYFVGAYAPFEKLFAGKIENATPAYIKTEHEAKSSQSLDDLLKHLRTQYGKTLRVAREKADASGFSAEDVLAIVERDGLPRTLIMPTSEAVCHLFGSRSMRPVLGVVS